MEPTSPAMSQAYMPGEKMLLAREAIMDILRPMLQAASTKF